MNKIKSRLAVTAVLLTVVAIAATACQTASGQTVPAAPATTTTSQQASPVQPTATPTATPTTIAYTGRFSLSPTKAAPGASVKATGSGFDPNQKLEIVWQGFQGSWNTNSAGEFHGRTFKNDLLPEATVTTDASGSFETSFTVPSGFGFEHDVLVQNGSATVNKAGFQVQMQASVSPSSGPLGTPITINLNGVGWRSLENSWMILYDNKFTGWMSSVTTGGVAQAVIPAVGSPGTHIIQIIHGSATFPYLNMQQSPQPDRPSWTFQFTVTDGQALLPSPAQSQGLPIVSGSGAAVTGGPAIWTDPLSAPVGTPAVLKGSGLPTGQTVEILWFRMVGSRVSGQGYAEDSTSLGTTSVDASGNIAFPFKALDDLGGAHRIEVHLNGQKIAETSFTISPSAFAIDPASGPAGTKLTIHLKGVGWTQTANIYTLVYDNAYVGYACGFNSQGDVTVYLPATGEPGWHFIDLYPGIYQGDDMQTTNDFRIPQLTYTDHPGEKLPAFHFAFQITG